MTVGERPFTHENGDFPQDSGIGLIKQTEDSTV